MEKEQYWHAEIMLGCSNHAVCSVCQEMHTSTRVVARWLCVVGSGLEVGYL